MRGRVGAGVQGPSTAAVRHFQGILGMSVPRRGHCSVLPAPRRQRDVCVSPLHCSAMCDTQATNYPERGEEGLLPGGGAGTLSSV